MGNVESKKKCTQDQTKHDYKTEGISTDQAAKTQSNWASAELLDMIEAVPYHEYFIHVSLKKLCHVDRSSYQFFINVHVDK